MDILMYIHTDMNGGTMTYTATVAQWGNSQGLRLPAPVCRKLGFAVGDKLTLLVNDRGEMVITSAEKKYFRSNPDITIVDLFKNCEKIAQSTEIDWGVDVGAEVVE
jgi:antitoxin component of MazEF toxin-antitoxin module